MFAHWNSKHYVSIVKLGLGATSKVNNFTHFLIRYNLMIVICTKCLDTMPFMCSGLLRSVSTLATMHFNIVVLINLLREKLFKIHPICRTVT